MLYAVDKNESRRQTRANDILRRVNTPNEACLLTQVLSEFANVILRRRLLSSPDAISQQIQRYRQTFPVLPVTPFTILEAVRGVRDYQFSFYDAQIWAVARLNAVPIVLSEDFNSGASIEGITFLNPFPSTFDIDQL